MVNRLQEPGFIEYLGDFVVIIGHHNADLDAIGAAQGVKELIMKIKPDTITQIVMPEDISRLSEKIIETLQLEVFTEVKIDYDTIIIVDSGNFNQLGAWAKLINESNEVIILIDHHTLDDELCKKVDLLIHDDEASSTCEIIHRLYEKYQIQPSIQTSKSMISGIAFDTKFFSIGDKKTFNTISKLLENIEDVSEVLSMLHLGRDIPERIARLKTGQRSEIHRVGNWILAFSEVSSFQASGARALISLGADIAAVIGSDKEKIRASLRSTQEFYKNTRLHLGELVMQLRSEIGGSGSGHPTAAGYNGEGNYEVFTKKMIELVHKNLRE